MYWKYLELKMGFTSLAIVFDISIMEMWGIAI